MKTIGVVALCVPVAYAVKGFTYNDDVVCGYPFEDFVIESISCAPSSYVHVWPEGGEPSNLYDSHDVCAFGNEMEIVGRVTVSQALSRVYHANLQACFRTSELSWYSAKKCMLFKTTMDLRTYVVQEEVEEGQGEEADAEVAASQTYYNYVEPGEFAFSARVVIPKKTFVFNADYIVKADLSLVPDSYSVDADTYKFTSVCSATFNAVYDASENRYSNKYAAATILAVGLLCSVYIAGGKTRRICTGNKDDMNEGDSDFVEMNKIDEEVERKTIQFEESTSQTDSNFPNEKRPSKKLFADFFRRQAKAKPTVERTDSVVSNTDSVIHQRNAFVVM